MTLSTRSGTGAARPEAPFSSRALALALVMALMAVGLSVALLPVVASPASANAPGFSDNVVFTGLDGPTAFQFSADGRVFVAEKSGLVKVFDSFSDPTPDVFVDLRTQVHNWYDRGLLGLALAPTFPANPYVYVLYAHDAVIGGTAPLWGTAGQTSDPCPNDVEGCVISGRLSRFLATGNTAGPEQVLIEDWCAQFPSHTIGNLKFGPDGALYASGGEGASFTFTDYGQVGGNPCNDYPGGPNLTVPDSRGGALRSQKVITDGVPVTLNGTVIRVDPATGEGLPSNPYASSADANARRIIASGLRNPFRFNVHPGTQELYIGDVGANTWEEINVVDNVGDGVAENFGWPCYEGDLPYGSFQSLGATLCTNLYTAGTAKQPLYKYKHGDPPVPGDTCGPGGGDSTSGIAFNDNSNNYPAEYDGAMFFADIQHSCIWVMSAGTDGKPDPTTARNFMRGVGAVYLTTGPEGDLWFANINGGSIHRISYGTTGPANCLPAQYVAEYFNNREMNGAPALSRCETVIDTDYGFGTPAPGINADQFSVRWTTSPVLAAATYEFRATADDGVRVYVDGELVIDEWHDQPATLYTATRSLTAGAHTIRVEYYENGAAGLARFSYGPTAGGGDQAPTATINSPTIATTWKVGDPITFAGSATDPQEGNLPASALTWRVAILHCPDLCHEHVMQTFTGVAGGSIIAPDHDYPTQLQFQLTATDSGGFAHTTTRLIGPQTATLRYESVPSGLTLADGAGQVVTPFERTVVVGSVNSVTAPTPQTLAGASFDWASWSDGGARSHIVTAGPGVTTLTATFTQGASGPIPCPTGQFLAEYFNNMTLSGAPVLSRCEAAINYDWGGAAPGPGVNADGYSTRWTGSHVFTAGSTEFTAIADDGVRVFVDGVSLIDQWNDQGATTYKASRTLTAGAHIVRMEYYENGGGAVAKLSWATSGPPVDPGDPGTCAAGQFLAEYFNNITLSGAPVLSRCEAAINYDWGGAAPGPGVNADGYSTRWTGSPVFTAGSTEFTAIADDGVRVFVDGVSLIDQWHDQGATTYKASRTLTAGAHIVRMEYYENGGGAVAKLSWANIGVVPNQAPTATITAPTSATAWVAGATIAFAGSATDPEQGALAASALTWRVSVLQCPNVCQPQLFQTFTGVASGSFVAPAVQAQSTLLIELTAVDSAGLDNTATVVLSPQGTGTCAAGQFLGEYFNNLTLSGAPVLARCEAAINYDWAGGSPGPGVNVDGFSVRWTGSPVFAAGATEFTTTADDGVRVFVDGVVLIDQWHDQGATTYKASRTLTAGAHAVRMEFYENGGGALARLSWANTGVVPNQAPTATITAPTSATAWVAGATIAFAGSATDPEQGALAASALTWRVSVLQCPNVCQQQLFQTFTGVASGSFVAPAVEAQSTLLVELTAVDSAGLDNTATVQLSPPATGSCAAGQFIAEYFNNLTLSGAPVLARCEATINNDWGGGSPGPGVNFDGFSVRWTGSPVFAAGSTEFTTTADDGVRVFVDGVSLIDQWHDQGATTYTSSRTLTAGSHIVRMEFYENGGGALARLSWATLVPPGDPGTCAVGQFLAEYFNNLTLSGAPVLSRCEAAINYDWGGGSPGPGVNVDGFSVRWTASPVFTAGSHLFTTTADDGVRVFVDDVSLIDQWHDQGATTYTASRTLTAGAHVVRVEYYERGGGAVAKLSWT